MLQFKKDVSVDSKEDKADVEYDPNEEDADDGNIDNQR